MTVETGAAYIIEKSGKITEIPLITLKDILRDPLECLVCGLGVAMLIGSVWIENRLNMPGMYKAGPLVKPRRC